MGIKKLLKLAGFCGILSPIIAFTCIGFAIFYSPWFSWTENWLSDLGGMVGEKPIWAARGVASIIFNIGLILAGIFGMMFTFGFIKSGILTTNVGRLGASFLILCTCALCAIGIFPETTGSPHTVASVIFFFSVPLSLLFIGITIKKFKKTLGLLVIILGVISLVISPFLLIPRPWGSNAIIEMVPSTMIAIFIVVFGIKLLMQASKITKNT